MAFHIKRLNTCTDVHIYSGNTMQYGRNTVQYKTANINGLDILYREAGNRKNPTPCDIVI